MQAFLYAKNRILSGGGVRGTKKSLLCCAKQASPATPSWVVSVSPTGIRRGGFAHLRKIGSFKVLVTAGTHLFILLSQQVEILIST